MLELPRYDGSDRIRASHVACELSVEHWDAMRILFGGGYVSSAIALHRLQFEALVRSLWLLYAALDDQVAKLAAQLDVESEQQAKNLPLVADMMNTLSKRAPVAAYEALKGFRDASWKPLNSYVHAGIHPLYRLDDGYPVELVDDIVRMTNGLGILSGKQASALAGSRVHMKEAQRLCFEYRDCLPTFK
jgi:hypothetical protein